MLPSISKVWSEVSEESNNVKFNVDRPSKKSTHYIHHDKPSKHLLQKVRSTEGQRTGSPRILKPVGNDNKQNSLWGAAIKNITKVFKKEDEITSMKHYMDGMIGKPRAMRTVENDRRGREQDSKEESLKGYSSNRPTTTQVNDVSESRRRRRTDSISARIDELTNSLGRRKKRRRHQEAKEPENISLETSSLSNTSIRPYESSYVPKYIEDSKRRLEQYQSRRSTERHVDSSWKSIAANKSTEEPPVSSSKIRMSKITARELPSSPVYSLKESTPKSSKRSNTTTKPETTITDSTVDRSLMDSSRIDELCAKVQLLENTVQELKAELKTAKSQPLQSDSNSKESSFESIKSPEKPTIETKELIFEDNISRPLSPVKLDLERFKIIK